MLIWPEDAPVFEVHDDVLVTNFVDNIICCQWPDDDTELQKLVNRQIHRHSHTCKKKSKNECRFNYPQPPMRATEILYPLENDTSPCEIKQLKETWKTIKKQLNDLKEGECMTFEELLLKLKVTENDYRLAVRSSLNAPTVFLKRKPNELRINNYNPPCLKAWKANMDVQFVLDVYACAMYIVSYISKAQKGMSELLRQACAEARKGNSSIKQQVRDIGNKFLNSVEISAQEAVYIVLQLPMKKSSREVLFINTAPPNERVQLLKPINDIKEMEDDCQDVYTTGLLQRYAKRTASLEHLTLADWAAWYDLRGKPYVEKSFLNDSDNLPLETANDDENDDELCDDKSIIDKKNKKRSKSRIIRSVWFNKEKDPEKHYRELIMLFTSWRNEETDLLAGCPSYQACFLLVKDMINKQMKQYAVCSDALDKIHDHIIALDENVEQFDSIAPFTHKGGGCVLYYAENLNVIYRRDLSDKNLEAIWIQVNFSSGTALFSVVYRAPDDNDFFDRFQKQLESAWLRSAYIFLLGDLNCDLNVLNTVSRSKNAAKLLSIFDALNLENTITSPTRVTPTCESLIDLIVTSKKELIHSSGVFHLGISDHSLIHASIRLSRKRPPAKIIKTRNYKNFNESISSRIFLSHPFMLPLFSTILMTNYGPGTSYSLTYATNTHLSKM